jgi:hypothetical protein
VATEEAVSGDMVSLVTFCCVCWLFSAFFSQPKYIKEAESISTVRNFLINEFKVSIIIHSENVKMGV